LPVEPLAPTTNVVIILIFNHYSAGISFFMVTVMKMLSFILNLPEIIMNLLLVIMKSQEAVPGLPGPVL
jgi:hypothetical protein